MSRGIGQTRRQQLIRDVAQAIREYGSANDAVDAAVAARLGINRTDTAVLDLLDQRGPLTAGGIAEATGLTTGAITAVIDRLEKKGYARRRRDTSDRRKVEVELTPKVRKLALELYGPLAEAGYRNLNRYADEDLEVIRDVIVRGRDLLLGHARTLIP